MMMWMVEHMNVGVDMPGNPLVCLEMSDLACLCWQSNLPLVKAVVMQIVQEKSNLIGGHVLNALGGWVEFRFYTSP